MNKNTVPNEKRSPFVTSGVRIGTPALTTRQMGPTEMKQIATWIAAVLAAPKDESKLKNIRAEVRELCARFPIYRADH